MKIHIWAPSYWGFGGGITKFSRAFVSCISEDVRLFGKFDSQGEWRGNNLSGAGKWPGFLKTPVFTFQLILGAFLDRPQFIVSTHVNFGPVALLIKRWLKIPYVLVAHGIEVLPQISSSRRRALIAADRVLCVSRWTQSLVRELGVNPSRVGVILNAVSESRFSIKSKSPWILRDQLGISETAKIILTVARLSALEGYKGHDRLLRSLTSICKELGEVVFVIVGTGDDQLRLEKLAAKLGVAESVRFAGFVGDEKLPDFYSMADVFAMPSTGEGYGIVFLEAMACGTPVLAGNKDGSVDALDDGRLGVLVDPTDNDSITRGLILQLKQEGPDWWYDPEKLRESVIEHAGRETFKRRIASEIVLALDD